MQSYKPSILQSSAPTNSNFFLNSQLLAFRFRPQVGVIRILEENGFLGEIKSQFRDFNRGIQDGRSPKFLAQLAHWDFRCHCSWSNCGKLAHVESFSFLSFLLICCNLSLLQDNWRGWPRREAGLHGGHVILGAAAAGGHNGPAPPAARVGTTGWPQQQQLRVSLTTQAPHQDQVPNAHTKNIPRSSKGRLYRSLSMHIIITHVGQLWSPPMQLWTCSSWDRFFLETFYKDDNLSLSFLYILWLYILSWALCISIYDCLNWLDNQWAGKKKNMAGVHLEVAR